MNPAKINSTMAAFAKENQRMEMAQGGFNDCEAGMAEQFLFDLCTGL